MIKKAFEDLTSGKPILIFDFRHREAETDMVYYSGLIDEDSIYRLRTEAGGLICYATDMRTFSKLGIPMLSEILCSHELLRQLARRSPSYGLPSTLFLWVNHVGVRTGISDRDRALTVKRLHEVIELVQNGKYKEARESLLNDFYFPGHVPILVSNSLDKRQGHTELSVSLALMVGLSPSVVFAEMLDKGVSMSLSKAEEYARRNNLTLVKGEDVVRYALERGMISKRCTR